MKDCRYEQQTHFQDYEKKGTFDDCLALPKAFTRPPRFPQWIDLVWRFEQCVLFCAEGAEQPGIGGLRPGQSTKWRSSMATSRSSRRASPSLPSSPWSTAGLLPDMEASM